MRQANDIYEYIQARDVLSVRSQFIRNTKRMTAGYGTAGWFRDAILLSGSVANLIVKKTSPLVEHLQAFQKNLLTFVCGTDNGYRSILGHEFPKMAF